MVICTPARNVSQQSGERQGVGRTGQLHVMGEYGFQHLYLVLPFYFRGDKGCYTLITTVTSGERFAFIEVGDSKREFDVPLRFTIKGEPRDLLATQKEPCCYCRVVQRSKTVYMGA